MFGLSSVFLSSVACPSVCLSFVRPSVSGYEARKHSQRTKGKRATGRKAFGFGRRERTGGGGGGVVHSYTHSVLKWERASRLSLRTLVAFEGTCVLSFLPVVPFVVSLSFLWKYFTSRGSGGNSYKIAHGRPGGRFCEFVFKSGIVCIYIYETYIAVTLCVLKSYGTFQWKYISVFKSFFGNILPFW